MERQDRQPTDLLRQKKIERQENVMSIVKPVMSTLTALGELIKKKSALHAVFLKQTIRSEPQPQIPTKLLSHRTILTIYCKALLLLLFFYVKISEFYFQTRSV